MDTTALVTHPDRQRRALQQRGGGNVVRPNSLREYLDRVVAEVQSALPATSTAPHEALKAVSRSVTFLASNSCSYLPNLTAQVKQKSGTCCQQGLTLGVCGGPISLFSHCPDMGFDRILELFLNPATLADSHTGRACRGFDNPVVLAGILFCR